MNQIYGHTHFPLRQKACSPFPQIKWKQIGGHVNDAEGIGFSFAWAKRDMAVATINTALNNLSFFMDLISFGLDKEGNIWPGRARGSWHEEEEVSTEFCFSTEDLRVKKLYEISGRNSYTRCVGIFSAVPNQYKLTNFHSSSFRPIGSVSIPKLELLAFLLLQFL